MQKGLSKRTVSLLEMCAQQRSAVAAAHFLVKEMLAPYGDDPYLTYRYEHSLRVAGRGIQIAKGEGWDAEPLLIACLLHDVGYPECRTEEDFSHHQDVSARIAELFLNKIGYDPDCGKAICRAIQIHNLWDEIPNDASPFELSVRDADDLDRFDALRTYMKGNEIVGNSSICDRSAEQVIAGCTAQLQKIERDSRHVCATRTARVLWEEQLRERRAYFEMLLKQMQRTQDVESLLHGLSGDC